MRVPANRTEKARASSGRVCLITQVNCVSIVVYIGEGTAESYRTTQHRANQICRFHFSDRLNLWTSHEPRAQENHLAAFIRHCSMAELEQDQLIAQPPAFTE
jgi:hypothetical protein